MVAEGDMVAVRDTYRGTDATTGERAAWPEMVFTRFAGGSAVESWEIIDTGRGPIGRRGKPSPSASPRLSSTRVAPTGSHAVGHPPPA